MSDMMWIYAVIFLLSSDAAQGLQPTASLSGTSTSVYSNTSSRPPQVYAVRNSTFNLGSDVDLTCSSKTWNETLFVTWNINLKYKRCRISFSNDQQSVDSCNDGKSLRNTSRALSYLHIPNFSNDDVGVYKCESVYKGGAEAHVINVAITVPPSISSWIERKDNKLVAVCKAEGGQPLANISWSHMGNSSSVETLLGSHGVESRLELLKGMDTENLSCVIRHPFWKEEKILVPKPQKGYGPWLYIPFVLLIVLFLAGFLLFAQKKLTISRRCQQSDASPSKPPPREEVEEVEPYASYVQRVNSIYN